MTRISLGLTSLSVSLLFAAHALGLFPDTETAELKGRKALCESLAIACSLAAERGDVPMIENLIQSIGKRNPEVLSAAARRANGDRLLSVGDHTRLWGAFDGKSSTPTHMRVTVAMGDQPWGTVEVRYKPLYRYAALEWLGGSLFPVAMFVAGAGLPSFYLYLRSVLRTSAHTGAGVVPDRVRDTLNTVMEGVLLLDRNERIALANDSFAMTVGVPAEALRGRRASELCTLRDQTPAPLETFPWARAIVEGVPQRGSILRLRKGVDRPRKVSVNSTSILGDDGFCRGALVTFDDLTPVEDKNAQLRTLLKRLKRAQARTRRQKLEIEKARDEAEAANRAKSAFLANVSHEIRTPMNAILGMTEAALDTGPSFEQRECLDIVKVSAESLLSVINDLLDLGKIESGKFDLDPVPFAIAEVAETAMKTLAQRARQKGLTLRLDLDSSVPRRLIGDDARLRQILINLIGNALKFTERGGVSLAVQLDANDRTGFSLHFRVTDTGIGIAPEKVRSIFDPFTQADHSIARRFGGTGLGLTISAKLVEMMGGRIWVESELDRGSTFHFTAHFEIDPSSASKAFDAETEVCKPIAAAARPKAGLRVLLVDDNVFNRKVGVQKLTKMGHEVTVAESGKEALGALAAQAFDLVFMDLHMKDMNGLEATARIRRAEADVGAGRRTPVIAMTAAAMKEDRELCLSSGMDGFVSKPIRDHDLLRAIEAAAIVSPGQGRRETSIEAISNGSSSKPARWLASLGGNAKLLGELVATFREDCPLLLKEIDTSIVENQPDALRQAAHTLKSMLLFFEATEASDTAGRLETLGNSMNFSEKQETFSRLSRAVGRLLDELGDLSGDARR